MAKKPPVNLVSECTDLYHEAEVKAELAENESWRIHWMTKMYEQSWFLAQLTDEDRWWGRYETIADTLTNRLQGNI